MNIKLKNILGASAIIIASIGVSAIPTHAGELPNPKVFSHASENLGWLLYL